MNRKTIHKARKIVRFGAGILAVALVFTGEIRVLSQPGKHARRAASQVEPAELFPHQDVFLPPW
jgi:hypothetical protein